MGGSEEEHSVGGDIDGPGSFRVRMPASLRMDQASFHDKTAEGVTHENDGSLEGFL